MVYSIRTHTSDEPGIGTFGCSYCGGVTFNDDRGNCCACGAPRGRSSKKNTTTRNNVALNITVTKPGMSLYEFESMANKLCRGS
jgi:ribosomal protein L37E